MSLSHSKWIWHFPQECGDSSPQIRQDQINNDNSKPRTSKFQSSASELAFKSHRPPIKVLTCSVRDNSFPSGWGESTLTSHRCAPNPRHWNVWREISHVKGISVCMEQPNNPWTAERIWKLGFSLCLGILTFFLRGSLAVPYSTDCRCCQQRKVLFYLLPQAPYWAF